MKKLATTLLCALAFAACTNNQPEDNKNNQTNTNMENTAKVYLTRNISPEALVNIYKALGVEAKGRVAVKISTGEGSNPNYLKPLTAMAPATRRTSATIRQSTGKSSAGTALPTTSLWTLWMSTTKSASP